MNAAQRVMVLSKYRELLRLISRLPPDKREEAFREARFSTRSRRSVTNAEDQLKYLKELISKIGYLRIITPKVPGEIESGIFVVRGGDLVGKSGDTKGTRVADGTISREEAIKRNERDFRRFYGAPKPNNILF
ncbi:hypothetical protein VaNZ11_004360 [Volvox africanus]|uniref:Mitochondrial ribosomal protein S8 n=1 Tax=Volvox africanus TaxID=51714 RepID=A0ABQ5RXS6_9CHLO|nr:hypothetical protein VaNZ11_004360 [Volvox africanus]